MAEVMDLSIMEKVVIQGDLSSLKPEERFVYYTKVCESVGLNPLTKPFDYLKLDGKLVLYAKRDATDQLRKIQNISITITSREKVGDVYCVTARGTTQDGRTDESIGAVSLTKEEKLWDEMRNRKVPTGRILPLTADELANAIMKAETKAKRRVTLSLSGLGMMDDSEIETVQDAERIEVGEPVQSTQQNKKKPSSGSAPSTQSGSSENKGQKNATSTKPTPSSSAELYRMLDMATGVSPGGVTFAKLRVVNITTGEESVVLANTPVTIEQINTLSNISQFEIEFEMNNGFKMVKSIAIVGEAA